MKNFLRDRWFSIDHRTLGLFRIAFGLCLLGNLYDHAAGGNLVAFFSNDGVLSNHLALFAPIQERAWSFLFAFSRPGEVAVAFAAIFVVYVLYTVGFKTRLMQILVPVCFISIVNRNLLLQDGGSFTCTILAVWTLFLPLGHRFSVDAWLSTPRPALLNWPATGGWHGLTAGEPAIPVTPTPAPAPMPRPATMHVSFVCFALLLQLAAIYGFNAANKTGETWRAGTAVHYILWQLSRNTAIAGFLRLHEPGWFSPVLTRATLVIEWAAPVLALMPVFQTYCRRALIVGIWALHLGIASLMSLGPFSYAMMTFSILMLRPADWEALGPVTRRLHRIGQAVIRRVPVAVLGWAFNFRRDFGTTPRGHAAAAGTATTVLREGVAVILFVAMVAELTLANAVVPPFMRWTSRPEALAHALYYLRVYQTWGMFSPEVPTNDGGLVVDALLADGTRIDPLTGRAPDFEAPLHGPYGLDHDWSEYMYYYPWDRHQTFRGGLRDYVLHKHHDDDPSPEKAIRSLDIYRVSADCPPPGETQPRNLKRELMISHVVSP